MMKTRLHSNSKESRRSQPDIAQRSSTVWAGWCAVTIGEGDVALDGDTGWKLDRPFHCERLGAHQAGGRQRQCLHLQISVHGMALQWGPDCMKVLTPCAQGASNMQMHSTR